MASLKPHIVNQFLSVLVLKEPHAMRSCESHCLYISALLNIMKRPLGVGKTEKVWRMIIQHLTFVDSSILNEDLVRDSEVDNDLDESSMMFECDVENQQSQPNGKISGSSQQKSDAPRILASLDAMMELIFLELEQLIQKDQFDQIWRVMIIVFDSLLVTTHQAQFTHFLLFYLIQKKPKILIKDFSPLCLEKVENEWLGVGLRSSYASYIVSLLARSEFASLDVKLKCLECLLRTSEKHARNHPENKKNREKKKMCFIGLEQQEIQSNLIEKHEVFFACIQGIMYLLCYLLPPLFTDQQGNWETKEKVIRIEVWFWMYWCR